MNGSGEPCRRYRLHGSRWCAYHDRYHRPQSPEVLARWQAAQAAGRDAYHAARRAMREAGLPVPPDGSGWPKGRPRGPKSARIVYDPVTLAKAQLREAREALMAALITSDGALIEGGNSMAEKQAKNALTALEVQERNFSRLDRMIENAVDDETKLKHIREQNQLAQAVLKTQVRVDEGQLRARTRGGAAAFIKAWNEHMAREKKARGEANDAG